MTRKGKRLASIGAMMAVVALSAGLVLTALSEQAAYFRSPTDLAKEAPGETARIRLGGIVKDGSIDHTGGETVTFVVTDSVESVPVRYTGILPDLFREGQGVVAEGVLGPDHAFMADTVLAKHDENYMPKEVVDDLKARGLWDHNKGMVSGDGASPEAEGAMATPVEAGLGS